MITKNKLLAKLEDALETEEKGSMLIAKVLRKKVAESQLPTDGKSRLTEILNIIEKDSREHMNVISDKIDQITVREKDEF